MPGGGGRWSSGSGEGGGNLGYKRPGVLAWGLGERLGVSHGCGSEHEQEFNGGHSHGGQGGGSVGAHV